MNPPPPRGAAGPPDDTAPPRAEQSRRRLRAAARRRGAGDGRSLPPTAQRHRRHHRRSSCAAATVSRSGATPPLAPDLLLKHPALELVASASAGYNNPVSAALPPLPPVEPAHERRRRGIRCHSPPAFTTDPGKAAASAHAGVCSRASPDPRRWAGSPLTPPHPPLAGPSARGARSISVAVAGCRCAGRWNGAGTPGRLPPQRRPKHCTVEL